jgi:hypothetical protein
MFFDSSETALVLCYMSGNPKNALQTVSCGRREKRPEMRAAQEFFTNVGQSLAQLVQIGAEQTRMFL